MDHHAGSRVASVLPLLTGIEYTCKARQNARPLPIPNVITSTSIDDPSSIHIIDVHEESIILRNENDNVFTSFRRLRATPPSKREAF